MHKKLFTNLVILLFLFLNVFSLSALHADSIYLRDGRIIRNIDRIKDTGNYFLVYSGNKTTTYSKQIIEKILSDDGSVMFEHKELTAEKINGSGVPEYAFFLNGEKIGYGGWNTEGRFSISHGKIPDGVYKMYFNTGKLERTFSIKDNQLNGTVYVYFNTGKLSRKGTFVDGLETGESELYYKTGELKGKSSYKSGLKNGRTYLYYRSGKIKAEMNFYNGNTVGLQKMFFENGHLSNLVSFKNGKKDGEFKQFYENGNLKISGQTKDGKLDGIITVYYESGRIKSQKTIENGRIIKADS